MSERDNRILYDNNLFYFAGDLTALKEAEGLMTGQEWYDRFKQEYNYLSDEPIVGNPRKIAQIFTDRITKAAKKAAGIE